MRTFGNTCARFDTNELIKTTISYNDKSDINYQASLNYNLQDCFEENSCNCNCFQFSLSILCSRAIHAQATFYHHLDGFLQLRIESYIKYTINTKHHRLLFQKKLHEIPAILDPEIIFPLQVKLVWHKCPTEDNLDTDAKQKRCQIMVYTIFYTYNHHQSEA